MTLHCEKCGRQIIISLSRLREGTISLQSLKISQRNTAYILRELTADMSKIVLTAITKICKPSSLSCVGAFSTSQCQSTLSLVGFSKTPRVPDLNIMQQSHGLFALAKLFVYTASVSSPAKTNKTNENAYKLLTATRHRLYLYYFVHDVTLLYYYSVCPFYRCTILLFNFVLFLRKFIK